MIYNGFTKPILVNSFNTFQIVRIHLLIWHLNMFFLLAVQAAYRLDVPWDNSVNKTVIIYAVATTPGVRNMPLTS